MTEYASARHAADVWFCLTEAVQAGFLRSADMLELCANAHNHDAGTVTTDHAWVSEIEDWQELTVVMKTTYRAVGEASWRTWFAYRYRRIGKRAGVVLHVDSRLEWELKLAGMLKER